MYLRKEKKQYYTDRGREKKRETGVQTPKLEKNEGEEMFQVSE